MPKNFTRGLNMTDTEIELREIKCTMRRMQQQLDIIEKYFKEAPYNCMALVPSTQACNDYDRE